MKPVLVLIPGLLCDARLWAPQVEAFADLYDVFIPDLTRDDTMTGMAARVLAEAPERPLSVAGLSMGGYVAQEMLRQAPQRIARLALLDTRARPDSADESERRRTLMRIAESAKGFAPVNKRMLPLLVHLARQNDKALISTIQQMAEDIGIPAYLRQQNAIMSRPDFRPALKAIRCPVLLLCGRQDAITPVTFHDEIAAGIPHARYVIVEDCGHLSTLEKPDEVNAALREWLGT